MCFYRLWCNEDFYRICRADVDTVAFNHVSMFARSFNNINKTKFKFVAWYIKSFVLWYVLHSLDANGNSIMIWHILLF